jgi:hypothetical protein
MDSSLGGPTEVPLNLHLPNAEANGGGKRIQDIYSRSHPFCESVVTILGLAELGDLLSKDGKDSLCGFAGLKGGKEGMRG